MKSAAVQGCFCPSQEHQSLSGWVVDALPFAGSTSSKAERVSETHADTQRNIGGTVTVLATGSAPGSSSSYTKNSDKYRHRLWVPFSSPAGRDRHSLLKAHTHTLGWKAHAHSHVPWVPSQALCLPGKIPLTPVAGTTVCKPTPPAESSSWHQFHTPAHGKDVHRLQ